MEASEIITLYYLRSQSIKLLRWRLTRVLWSRQLPFAKGMHDFNPRNRTARRPKGLAAQHRVSEPFHGSMILLHEVVEIFGVAHDDGRLVSLVVVRNGCRIRTALIDGNFLREPLAANGLV